MSERNFIYETLCSAFYGMDFTKFLGEAEGANDESEAYFHLGEKHPTDMQVVIAKKSGLIPTVEVSIHWVPVNDQTLLASQTFTMTTEVTHEEAQYTTEEVVIKVLNVFRKVHAGEVVPLA